jgi:heptosyltransferase-2
MARVLLVAPNWLGDCVMSQSLLSVLFDSKHQIDVLVKRELADIFTRMPEVSNIIEHEFKSGKLQFIQRVKLAKQLHYDMAFVLPNSWKSALIPFMARIPIRIGYLGELRYLLINKLCNSNLFRMVDRFVALSGATEFKLPQLLVNIKFQSSIMQQNYLYHKKFIIFCPAAEYGPSKRYPVEYFVKLAILLKSIPDYKIVVLGSAKDTHFAEEIMNSCDNALNLCGKYTLSNVVDLIDAAAVVITNDSGLMHVACATTTNVIAIYGSSSPDFTPPLSSRVTILRHKLPCSPCFDRTCKFKHYNCLRLIDANQVYQSILCAISSNT